MFGVVVFVTLSFRKLAKVASHRMRDMGFLLSCVCHNLDTEKSQQTSIIDV